MLSLYDEHVDRVYRQLALSLERLEDVEPMAESVFERAWATREDRADGATDGLGLATWIHALTARLLLQRASEPESGEQPPGRERRRASGLPTLETPQWREELDGLRGSLLRLPALERQLLILCQVEGLPGDTAVRILGLSATRSRALRLQAFRRLGGLLSSDGGPGHPANP